MLDMETTMYQEFEDEYESDLEDEFENEFESDLEWEDYPGLGQGEYEAGDESEAFFKKLRGVFKRIRKRFLPAALRVVGGAFGGPLGGMAARLLSRESEYEYELDGEFESDYELDGEFESDYELEGDFESDYELEPEDELELAMADVLANAASKVSSEAEAEAYVGAAAAKVLPKKAPISVKKMEPKIVKASAKLTRLMRKSSTTRPLVPAVPMIARLTGKSLAKQAARGKTITTPVAAKTMMAQTKKVLGNPGTCAKTVVKSTQRAKKVMRKAAKSAK